VIQEMVKTWRIDCTHNTNPDRNRYNPTQKGLNSSYKAMVKTQSPQFNLKAKIQELRVVIVQDTRPCTTQMLNNIHQCLLHAQKKDQTIAVFWVQGIRKFMQGIHAYAEQSHQINWQVLQILTQGLCNETPSNL
jgi:hypothetical protein